MTATLTAPTTTVTTIIDSPEWAWTEYRSEVIGSYDVELYDAYSSEIDVAAYQALSSALRQVWKTRGYGDVAEVPAHTFGELLEDDSELPGLTVADEDSYFTAWEAAIEEIEFTDLVESAGRYREYLASRDD